jgi:hypothetical protein
MKAMLLFMLVWSAVVTIGDISTVSRSLDHAQTAKWPTAPATITTNNLRSEPGKKGAIWYPELTYTFDVAGTPRTSHAIRPLSYPLAFGDRAPAEYILARYPQGSPVTAHFNPDNPAEAVLEAGIDDDDICWWLVSSIFNAIAITTFLLILGRAARVGPFAKRPVKTWDDGTTLRVRCNSFPPILAPIVIYGAGGMATFALLGAFAGQSDSTNPPLYGLAAIAALAAAAYIIQRCRVSSGAYDLIISRRARTASFPRARRKFPKTAVPFENIELIDLINGHWTHSRGNEFGGVSSWRVVVRVAGDKERTLVERANYEGLVELVGALRAEVG